MIWIGTAGTTKRFTLDDMKRNGVLVTAIDPEDQVAWQLQDAQNSVVASANGVHLSSGDWYVDTVLPTEPGLYEFVWSVTRTGTIEEWSGFVRVRPSKKV